MHNLVVCTLCSCYPWPTLGLPPKWYKAPAYRSRAVREPRKLLAEMGTDSPDDVEIRVWDSSAEVRYLVLPERPAGTDDISEEELAALVTRDSMIGVSGCERRPVSTMRSPLPATTVNSSSKRRGQARALAIAVALVDKLGLPWDAFRRRLMDEIATDPQRPYYESWGAALESMVVDLNLATPAALDDAAPTERAPL